MPSGVYLIKPSLTFEQIIDSCKSAESSRGGKVSAIVSVVGGTSPSPRRSSTVGMVDGVNAMASNSLDG